MAGGGEKCGVGLSSVAMAAVTGVGGAVGGREGTGGEGGRRYGATGGARGVDEADAVVVVGCVVLSIPREEEALPGGLCTAAAVIVGSVASRRVGGGIERGLENAMAVAEGGEAEGDRAGREGAVGSDSCMCALTAVASCSLM